MAGISHKEYTAAGREQIAMVDQLRAVYAGLAQQQVGDLVQIKDLERAVGLERQKATEAAREQTEHVKRWEKEERDAVAAAKELSRTMERLAQHTRNSAKEMSTLSQSAASARAAWGQVGAAITGVQSAIALGKQAFDVADQFAQNSLKAKTAAANLQLDIRGARQAFKGYVDDVEIARIANMAFELGVVQTGDELTALAAGVQVKAEKLGVNSTQLFENAVTAVGRGSKLILDNLGIILDQEKAVKIYAESLGVATDELTALQKEEAFQKAALIMITKAAKDAGVSVEGFAASWNKAKVSAKNFIDEASGFFDTTGRINEALRELDVEKLEQLKFGEMLDRTGSIENIKMFDELTGSLEKWDLSLVDLRMEADRLGISYGELIKRAIDSSETRAAEREKKAMEAEKLAQAEAMRAEADEAEHMAKLLDAQGIAQEIVNLDLERAIELRRQAAELAGDETEQLKQQRALELFQAKAEAPKRRGGGRGPSAADRIRVAGEGDVAQMEHEAELLAMMASSEDQIAQAEHRRREAALARLDLEKQALEATKARGAHAKQELANDIADVDRQREIIQAEAVAAARAEEAAWLKEGLDYQRAKIEADANEAERVVSLDEFRAKASAKRGEERRGLAGLGADEIKGIDLDETAAVATLEAKIQQIERQTEAELRQLDARAQLLALEDPQTEAEKLAWRDQARQIDHEREMLRIDQEDQRKQAFAALDQARAEAEIKRKEAVWKKTQAIASQGETLARSGLAITNLILDETIKDEDKRAKAKLRAEGMITIGVAAREQVNAVAAFASLNIPQGLAHQAAAIMGFVQGGIMLGGRVPGEHGGGAPAVGGGGVGGGGGGGDRNTSEAPAIPDSVPAADRQPRRLGGPRPETQGGVTVVIQGNVIGDEDHIEQLAGRLKEASYSNGAVSGWR